MSDIENELRRLGDSLRNQGSGVGPLPPHERRRIKVRRALFAAGGAVTAIGLVATATYGLGFVRDQRGSAPAEERRRGSERLTLYSHLGARSTAVIELYAAERTICYSLASIDGYGTFSRVAIVEGLDAGDQVAPGPDAENSGVSRGSAECVQDVEPSTIDSITAAPHRYFLLLDDPVSGERVSSLQYARKVDAPPCDEPLPFEPTYLPQGWASDLQPGAGGGDGGEVVGHFGNAAEPGTPDKAVSGFADLFAGTGPFTQADTSEIEVLGSRARLGGIHEGYSVEFSYEGCRYTLAGYGLDRRDLRRFATGLKSARATESDQSSEQDFSAIWPEDTSEGAELACRNDDSEVREHPETVVVAFADEVLGWDEVEVINRTREPQFADERFVYEVQRKGLRGSSPRKPAVIVDAVEVVEGCWSVGSVDRLPDRRPTGVSVMVEGRNVRIGVDTLGATSLRIDVVYGGGRVSETGRVGEQGLGEFRLGFDPDTSAYALILFYDEDGEIFSATTAKWPAGDFAAG